MPKEGGPKRSLADVLGSFDRWLATQPRAALAKLSPKTSAAQVAKVERKLGTKLPASLRMLYAWHDGERAKSGLFDPAGRELYGEIWHSYNDTRFELHFLSLAEMAMEGATGVSFDAEGECVRPAQHDRSAQPDKLVPFAWVRGLPKGRDDVDDVAKGHDSPLSKEDWLICVDTRHERVWMFELGNQGLEGVAQEASDVAAWFYRVLSVLEAPAKPAKRSGPPQIEPPAVVLLRLMIDKKLIELAEGADLMEVAARLGPLLQQSPKKIALKSGIDFFAQDKAVDEVFVDDDLLETLLKEFVG
jgi:hypothetical protein